MARRGQVSPLVADRVWGVIGGVLELCRVAGGARG